ncbi:MAPEG family protein [Ferriphaselus sp. R-1]|uniref:MAPEG family protein n=1 Tax=Ferriphaselus sp. R-1 TaxID=1485544 RepID=UPI000689AFC7|nr:MAPEG family protein [Ferriphaselus sp. R-1]
MNDILIPCIALIGLTATVWLVSLWRRIAEIRARQLNPQLLATQREISKLLKNTSASDNFKNLFEVPMLFYILCFALFVTRNESVGYLIAAWVFVALRMAHSLVQLTYNRVTHRFSCWLTSTLCLFGMWSVFAIERLS